MEIKLIRACSYSKKKPLLLLLMRTFIFLCCATVFGFTPNNAISQNSKIKINADKVLTVDEVFDLIMKQTDYNFIYEEGIFNDFPKVAVKKGIIRTNKLLEKSLSSRQINIIVTTNNNILIKENTWVNRRLQKQVSGKVTDQDGLPIVGATVLIKGTTSGIATDFDGNYTLMVPDPANVLVFSSLGFETQEVTVANQTTINVTLEEDINELDEIVINAGYYKVSQRETTGNISRIAAKEVEKQTVTNPISILQGRVPGINVLQNSGLPGASFDILIRGTNSITANNAPFYIINGVPFTTNSLTTVGGTILPNANPLNSINPNDIESIEILKDADATAIYGSRGANGVVLITTKKGKKGKFRTELNYSYGLGEINNGVDLLNTEQYLEMRNEAFANDGETPLPFNAPDILEWDPNRDIDWQEELIGGTSEISNIQASISGGSEQVQFSMGLGRYHETTVFPGDFDFERITSNFRIDYQSINKKFKASFSGNYSVIDNTLPNSNPITYVLTAPPNVPDFVGENGEFLFPWTNNPFAELARKFQAKTDNFIGNMVLSYNIAKNLELKSSFGYTRMQRDEINTTPQFTINPAFAAFQRSTLNYGGANVRTWITEPQINWKKDLGKGTLDILLGATFQESINTSISSTATNFSSDDLIESPSAAESIVINNDFYAQFRYQAFFGRLNYNWDRKYIVNITGRRDGSSRFGENNKFSTFGAIGASWIFSKENFLKDSNVLNYGKIRASYGITGNDQIGDYRYFDTWEPVGLPYDGIPGLQPTRIANPDFSWEENEKFEVGLELGFLRDRIYLETSYYKNSSPNLLLTNPLPSSSGFTGVQANLPALVENIGWEIELNTINISTPDFKWTTGFNITIPKNELVSFPNLEASAFNGNLKEGEPLSVQGAFHYTGVDPDTGVFTFEDLNDDGSGFSFPDDIQYLFNLDPEYYGGLQNNISFKNIELDFLFQFTKQTGNRLTNGIVPGFLQVNQLTEVLSRWQQPGDVSDFQQFTQSFGNPALSAGFQSRGSDYFFVDASYVRLKNVSLSYQFPTNIVEKLKLQNARIYIQGQNLFTITDYIGFDPEVSIRGINGSLPLLRTITTGIQLTF